MLKKTSPGKHKMTDFEIDNRLDVPECHIYTSYWISLTLDQEE